MKNVTKANFLFFMVIAVQIVLVFAVAFAAVNGFAPDRFTAYVLPELAIMFPCILYINVLKADAAHDITYDLLPVKAVFIITIFTFALIPISSLLNVITSFGRTDAGGNVMSQTENMPFWKMFIAIALVPAVCEEFVFRGCIYRGLRRKNRLGAIIISSLMFGIVHLNVNQFSYAFVIGIFFALMAEITGNMLAPTMAHLIFNGTSVFMMYITRIMEESVNTGYVEETGQTETITEFARIYAIITTLFTVAFIIGLAILFIILCMRSLCTEYGKRGIVREIFLRKGEWENTGNERFLDIFLIFGIGVGILFIVIFDIL